MEPSLICLVTRMRPASDFSNRDVHVDERVYVPALDRFPPALRDIVGLLPTADINGALLSAFAAGAMEPCITRLTAGLFAADPFLDVVELTECLRGCGLASVANYPTLQHYDGVTAEGLAAVGYHVDAEFAMLSRLAAMGFDVIAYVATFKAAEAALKAGFVTLAYHPGLPPLPVSERAALGAIRARAARAGARVLIHASTSAAETDDDHPIRP